ncbi:spike base protein, RCAP_Rcc01079 family [Marinovum sp.]|uniref:spike base protein, RCAP_Rcc01079 family n=1 Tax=Marinovum sp. TaxID=2024839 RepID=UPI002B26F09E|nr:hypothetical protein [Marinovum sp.]
MPISDPFASHAQSLNGPVTGGFDITPDDATDLTTLPRGLMVSTTGDVAVTFADGSSLVLPGLTPGVIYPLRTARVLASGTTATGLKGLV